MRLVEILSGAVYTIWALDLASGGEPENCPAKLFLVELGRTHPRASRELAVILDRHANYGPIKNEQKSRSLGDGIFEFKASQGQGHRILYFYQQGSMTILTHGFPKKNNRQTEAEKQRAIGFRDRWRAENR